MRRVASVSLVLAVACVALWAAYRFVLVPSSTSGRIGPEVAQPILSLQSPVEGTLLVVGGFLGWIALVAFWLSGRRF
ncbi:MAG: hypothetical protein JNM94_02400 [Phycisphaerae bacterium]|nr:hypothetical protein [Phycisphaerae bacterium]